MEKVEVGQIWESKDPREKGRRLRIVSIDPAGTTLSAALVGSSGLSGRRSGHTVRVFLRRFVRIT